MITSKGMTPGRLVRWSGHHMLWLIMAMTTATLLYYFEIIRFVIPWMPISLISTAVAFYVGFKNNQAYDRMWEARKIWGSIVNDSRTWGMMVDSFISNFSAEDKVPPHEIHDIKRHLIYRHLAWLYTLRSQLLAPTPWEHISQSGAIGRLAQSYQNRLGLGLINDDPAHRDIRNFVSPEEVKMLAKAHNPATQLINAQSRDLATLREKELIEDFRHMEMMRVLQSFYENQGKNERIKKFPLPRQYANIGRYFVGIFIFLLPFSMVPSLMEVGTWGVWMAPLVSALVGYIFIMMEIVGDYSENPFQGMANDIPMLSICRTIDIDLRQMLGETELPPPIEIKNNVLM